MRKKVPFLEIFSYLQHSDVYHRLSERLAGSPSILFRLILLWMAHIRAFESRRKQLEKKVTFRSKKSFSVLGCLVL
jgi:hypothetical protein